MGKTPIENQLTGAISAVTSGHKFDMIQHLLPQRLEDGQLINFKGVCIGQHDGEDQVFHDADIEAPSRMTQAFIKRMTDPIEKFIAGNEPTETEEANASEAAIGDGSEGSPSEEVEERLESREGVIIQELIDEGKFKKAKKVLKELHEAHPRYKEFKKTIKKALKKEK